MKNILHTDSHRFFRFWMRQDVKGFVTDGLEGNIGYLVRRHPGLHSLKHELYEGLAFGTHFHFIWLNSENQYEDEGRPTFFATGFQLHYADIHHRQSLL